MHSQSSAETHNPNLFMKYRSTWKEHPNTMKKKIGTIIWIIVGVIAIGGAIAFLALGS